MSWPWGNRMLNNSLLDISSDNRVLCLTLELHLSFEQIYLLEVLSNIYFLRHKYLLLKRTFPFLWQKYIAWKYKSTFSFSDTRHQLAAIVKVQSVHCLDIQRDELLTTSFHMLFVCKIQGEEGNANWKWKSGIFRDTLDVGWRWCKLLWHPFLLV